MKLDGEGGGRAGRDGLAVVADELSVTLDLSIGGSHSGDPADGADEGLRIGLRTASALFPENWATPRTSKSTFW